MIVGNDADVQALGLKKKHYGCLNCGFRIVEPLCPNCIAKEFKAWVAKFPDVADEVCEKVDAYLKGHKNFGKGSLNCVACGKAWASLCPYCFTNYLYKVLKESGAGVTALTEFLFMFNFDFEHNGYSLELEAYGGY